MDGIDYVCIVVSYSPKLKYLEVIMGIKFSLCWLDFQSANPRETKWLAILINELLSWVCLILTCRICIKVHTGKQEIRDGFLFHHFMALLSSSFWARSLPRYLQIHRSSGLIYHCGSQRLPMQNFGLLLLRSADSSVERHPYFHAIFQSLLRRMRP